MSITLTNGTLVQVNGLTVENDTIGASCLMVIDYLANTATFTLRTGVLSGGNLKPGQYGPTVTLTLNLATGAWTSFDPVGNALSGTVTGPQLANFIAQLKADRNLVETFAAGPSNIMPGVQVPW